jgi:hypothetical protein
MAAGQMTPATWVQWILVAAMAGGIGFGGSYLHDTVRPPRPDPFTGLEARALESRMLGTIAELDQRNTHRIDQMDMQGTRALQECRARVSALEAAKSEITVRLARIEELLVELRVGLGINTRPRMQQP